MNEKLDEIAARAFPEADHRAARCRKALDEAVAEEREACERIVAEIRDEAGEELGSSAFGLACDLIARRLRERAK